jgi:hypothetical protein
VKPPTPGLTVMAAGVAVVGAVLVSGVAAGPDRGAVPAVDRPATVPVTDAVLVCPAVAGADDRTTSVVSASSPGGSGTIEVRALAGSATAAPLAALAPGASVVRYSGAKGARTVPVLVHATGDRARGLSALVVTRISAGIRRSVSSAPCTEPTGDTWLAGGSTVSGRRDKVFLTNADQAPAVVDVSVFGPDGVHAPTLSQGVTVPSRAQVTLALDALAPGLAATAVLVHVRSGRVAAALEDASAVGAIPAGVDWVPPSTPPAPEQVVTGIPGAPVARHLLELLVPGDQDATVRVRFVTADGTLSPDAVNALNVPAGQLKLVNLDKVGVPAPYSLLVDGNRPVLAGVATSEGAKGKFTDIAWAGGSPAIVGGSVVVPWVDRTAAVSTTVQLTAAGSQDIVVRVITLGPTGAEIASHEYTVPAGRQLLVTPGSATLGLGSVLVQAPVGADLVVGWSTVEFGARGPLITGGPMLQTPLTVPQPPAVADPAVGFPGH